MMKQQHDDEGHKSLRVRLWQFWEAQDEVNVDVEVHKGLFLNLVSGVKGLFTFTIPTA
jgi:hypothetical protein